MVVEHLDRTDTENVCADDSLLDESSDAVQVSDASGGGDRQDFESEDDESSTASAGRGYWSDTETEAASVFSERWSICGERERRRKAREHSIEFEN